ncbi:hypothetical protein I4U23_020499 [Adineta vaga]|nr:hypothetical protein I4U23_020499 [Adineta vaga]
MSNTAIQDMIKNDYMSELNQFLAIFYERQYKDLSSSTYLFIPKDGLDRTVEELVQNKAMVTRFEAVMLKWHHQLKHVLLIQDRLMSTEDQLSGIDEEIHFWQKFLTDLRNIRQQIERNELQTIIRVLNISKSAYIQQFLQVEKEIQNFTEYVEDCLKFLKLLAEPSLQLNDASFEQLITIITDIYYRILIAWHHSKFFAIPERIKLIISKINNQIISQCSRLLNIKRLFQGYILSTKNLLQECFQIIDTYIETCLHILTMHDKYSTKPLMFNNFQKDDLFRSVQLYRQRLNEIDEICECMKLFGWYRNGTKDRLPIFSGIQGNEYQHILEQSQQTFDRALLLLKRKSTYILDISTNACSIWSQEFKQFLESIREIELIIVKLINESTKKTTTIEQIMDILDIFTDFQSRTTINHILLEKTRDIYRLFLSQIEDLRTKIVSHQTLDESKNLTNQFDHFLPYYSARAMWIRDQIERITKDYNLLQQSSNLPYLIQQNEMKLTYEKFLIFAESIIKRIYQDWWSMANELQPKKLLQKPFLKENQEKKYFIDVFFDPEIILALNESLWWIRLHYEIPYSLTDVYNTRKSFRQMREETNEFIRKFNKILSSLHGQELCIFEEHIRFILKKLQPAFLGKVNYIDENIFHDFAIEANRHIDQLTDMVTSFKENYIKCCTKCVDISQQLFVKIDAGIIFNYSTFTDLLKSVNNMSLNRMREMYEEMTAGIRVQQMIFKDNSDKIRQCWDHWLSSIDCMLEKALLVNVTNSLEHLSYIVNGDNQTTSTPFMNIELHLNRMETLAGNIKYTLTFRPTLEELTDTLNAVGQIQVNESLKHFVRLCDLFSYYSFQRESYYLMIDNHSTKQKIQNKITVGITNCIADIDKYVETNWFRFRQLWEVDKTSFIAVYESENTDLQGLEADIARYTEVANNINNQETIVNIRMIQIDCTLFKVSLIQICHQWQQSLIQIVLVRLEKDLQIILTLIKNNTEKINILPKTYAEIPIYQQFIDELKMDISRIETKLPLIDEEVTLLLRYEIEIDSKFLEQHHTLSRSWENYKSLLDESITSFKRVKEAFKVQLQKEHEKIHHEIIELHKVFQFIGPHRADMFISIALNDCEKIEEQIDEIENQEKRLKNAYRIFNLDMIFSKDLQNIQKDVGILKSIWLVAKEYEEMLMKWKTTVFRQLNINELNDFAQNQYKILLKMSREYKDKSWGILESLRERIDTFRRIIPLIESLYNPHMRSRHWEQIKRETEKTFEHESNQFTLEQILNLHFEENIQVITEISENATKEYAIERIVEKIMQTWNTPDEIIQSIEEHTAQISTIKGTRHVKAFQHEVDNWEKTIAQISELCDGLFDVQRQWLYMEGIFTSDDVQRQLPRETTEFKHVNNIWQEEILRKIRDNPNALYVATKLNFSEKIQKILRYLENIQKKMDDYLETKRSIFPRFYFISNEELVEILSLSRQPDLIQIHLKKLFENIKSLRLLIKKTILANGIISNENEEINLLATLSLEGNVELWLKDLETKMQITVREYLKNCLSALKLQGSKREKWIKDWPSQSCVTASEIEWTSATTKALLACQTDGSLKPLKKLFRTQIKILDRYSLMSRLSLDKILRLRINGIITKEVHGRDILERLIKTQTVDIQSFEWQMQLRFYWERYEQSEDCIIRQTITKFNYNYEYLGCTSRLVISPLTDRCYVTLTIALHLFRGGSSKGPAGTGKTETIKDLGKNFGIYVVVQNCSKELDYKSMGKMFSGFAQSGTWGCFDEFNRINIEVLSVIAQQIHSILTALSLKQKRFVFEGKEIPLQSQVGIFITMNPGYAGRTELPDNLKSMFRSVSMVVPDSIYIAENFLFSEGFQNTRNLARKVYTLYQLSAQQLSKQDHYDFGLRSLTAVLRYAGEKKRANLKMTDDEVLLLSMLDMNAPKMTAQDLPLFKNIVDDLFPNITIPKIDYSKLIETIENEMRRTNLQITTISIEKVIQLYETHHSRHSVMLVGKTLSGKTTTWKLFQYALTSLNKQGYTEFNKVIEYPINPKAVSLGELYGQFNLATNEWNDGILSKIMRQVCTDEKSDRKLILFDAPIDTSWIESMNSLMDDNKLLTLANGERISLSLHVTLLFETEDLSTASPATVSRAGIIYCDYIKLGWKPYFDSWLKQKASQDLQVELSNCLTKYLEPIMNYKYLNCKELVAIHELNGIISLTKLFDSFWYENDIQMQMNENEMNTGRLIEMWFVFCLIWSVGASVDDDGRKKIDIIFRETEGTFPNKDTVFEFYIDTNNRTWLHWEEQLKGEWIYDTEIPFYKMIVPTIDTVRYEYLISHLLRNKYQVLLVGTVGTGKTTVAENVLKKLDSDVFNTLTIHMSARTTSKMLQDIFESNLEKRTKNLFVPANGRRMIVFIDNMNMPSKDTYGFQPALELIRTWIDYEFWYDRKTQGMKYVKNMYLLTVMGPPGGGRHEISRRLQSRFNLINMTFPFEHEICRIFGTKLVISNCLEGKEDTWEEAKKDLANVDFIKTLIKFPKDDISDRTIRRMQPFINDSELVPEKLKAVSSAASALCIWIRAIESYARVYRIVQPKKERYQKAVSELNEKQNLLQESKNELSNIQNKIETLRLDYESKIKEKDILQRNADETAMFLDRATKLLDGVAEKRIIWDRTSKNLNENLNNLLGNSLLACAFLSYLGPFLSNYRDDIVHQIWEEELIRSRIHFETDFNFINFMTTPTMIREWNIQGLPRDNFSTENALLATRSLSSPLFIDPQNQATKWIKQMEKSHGLRVIDIQMHDYMKIIEECIKMGRPCLCQNLHEDIPQTLNPILIKSIKTSSDHDSHFILQLGDREIDYNPSFRFYLSTRLSNPHYKPEIFSKVNLINFALKEQGLEEQLLGIVVRKEKPDLENAKDNCIVTISNKHKEKEFLEEEFLRLLSETQGSLLENVKVFEALDLSKQSQKDIDETLKLNEDLELKIDQIRDNYRLVAQRAAILFFVLQDLTIIDPMYQFSLDAYIQLFLLSIEKSTRSLKLNERLEKLNDYHTYAVYKYGCRSLFERHKLLFSFHICTKIMDVDNRLNHDEYQFLIRINILTIDRETQFPNPFSTWLNDVRWDQMSELIRLPDYRFLRDSFDQFPKDWKEWYLSEEAEKASLPGTIDSLITEFGRILIVRCLRPDRITHCLLNFVIHNIGSKFVDPPILQLNTILEDSNKRSPIIFILSQGVDPSAKLQQLAEDKTMARSRYYTLSLGQGQATTARKLLETGMKKGHWIFLANCHLSISWLAELEKIVEQLQTAAVHNDFRLWLSSSPTIHFPISILQIGLKITNEPQKGIKANMKRLYELITPEQYQRVKHGEKYRKLLFALTFFHSIIIERKKFLQLGWNVIYTFNDSDFLISENLLATYLDMYEKTPFDALKYLIANIIYGGHCTDEWDMRLLQTYINSYIRDEILDVMHYKLSSIPYYYIPRDGTFKSYKDFINSMPTIDHPETFGQHPNADVTSQIQESKMLFETLLSILPQKLSATAEKEVENVVVKIVREMIKSMPHLIDMDAVKKYMLIDTSPLAVVLFQEAERYNVLLLNITSALHDLLKSIEGLVVMSIELEELFKCIYEGRLPHTWQQTYISLKSLPAWFQDLRQRLNFFHSWVENQRQPIIYWISAFSYPTSFLTAVLQRTARKDQIAIDQLSWEFDVNKIEDKYLTSIDDGVYITGLYLEGASWDRKQGILCEAQSMELVTIMPTIHFKPVEHKKKLTRGLYIAPCYYSSIHAGSFIIAVELKTGLMPPEHWIKRATTLLMNLDN